MFVVGSWSIALTALLLPAASGHAPTVHRYKIHQQASQEVDQTALGGPKVSTSSSSSIYVTVTLNDTAGGRTVHLVLDSLVADSVSDQAKPQLAQLADSLKGKAYHAYLPNGGRLTGLKPMSGDTGSMVTRQADGILEALFPTIKPSAKTGDTWADTTNKTNPVPSGSMTVRTVSKYKALGDEKSGGEKALRIQVVSSSSINGQQGPQSISGSGEGQSTMVVSASGRTLSSTGSSTMNMEVTVPQAPEPIPVTVQQNSTITELK